MKSISTAMFLVAFWWGPRAFATPLLVYVTPSRIMVGTNSLDNGAQLTCKLQTTDQYIVLRETDWVKIERSPGDLVYDSKDEVWRALYGVFSTDIHVGIFDALRVSGKKIIETAKGAGIEVTPKFLDDLTANLLIVSIQNGVPKLELFEVSYRFPDGFATFKTIAYDHFHSAYFKLLWVGDDAPRYQHLAPDQSVEEMQAEMRTDLLDVAKFEHRASFNPPFVGAIADQSGVRWSFGSQAECGVAKGRSLRAAKKPR